MTSTFKLISCVAGAAVWLILPSNVWAQPSNNCFPPDTWIAATNEAAIKKNIPSAHKPIPTGTVKAAYTNLLQPGKILRSVRLSPNRKAIALTFDLCEQPDEITGYQAALIDYLRRQRIPATFFLGGKWIKNHQYRTQQLMSTQLFEVGNHSWSHRNFQVLGRSDMLNEVAAAQLAIHNARHLTSRRNCSITHTPSWTPLFRFPYGACNSTSLAVLKKYGLTAIQWDISSADPWKGQTAAGAVRTVLSKLQEGIGHIVLFHANGRGWSTEASVPMLVKQLRRRGYTFHTVSSLIKMGQPIYANSCYDERSGDSDRYQALARRLELRYKRFYEKYQIMPYRLPRTPEPVRQSPAPSSYPQKPPEPHNFKFWKPVD